MELKRTGFPECSPISFTLLELLVVVAIIAILAAIAVPNFLDLQTRSKVARVKADMYYLAQAINMYAADCGTYPSMTSSLVLSPNGSWRDDDASNSLNNFMRYDGGWGTKPHGSRCPGLTTPVAYLSSPPPPDPFIGKMELSQTGSYSQNHYNRKNCSYFFYNFKGAARKIPHPELWPALMAPVVCPAPMRFNGPTGPVYPAEWAMLSPGPDRTFQVNDPAGGDPWVSYQFFQTHHHWAGLLEGRHHLYDPSNGTVSAGDIWRTHQSTLP